MAAADLDPEAAGAAPPPAQLDWPLLARLPQRLAEAPGTFREVLGQAHEELKARFLADEPVEALLHARATLIDRGLQAARVRPGGAGASAARGIPPILSSPARIPPPSARPASVG